jgi:carbon storage regulator
MLILTRRIGESIIIGEEMNISVKILRIDENQVKIGVQAPKDIPVNREEITKRIIKEREYEIVDASFEIIEDEGIVSESKIYSEEGCK